MGSEAMTDSDDLEWAAQEWNSPPYTVEAHSGQDYPTFTLTLDEGLLDSIFDPLTPIYHAFSSRKTNERELLAEYAPAHSVLASVKAIDKNVDTIYQALRNCLKGHPHFGQAKASWIAPGPPHAPYTWATAKELCEHLKKTLFASVGAILELLPSDDELSIVEGDCPTTILITATTSVGASTSKKRARTEATTRVVMVIDVMPWLESPDIEFMETDSGVISPEALLPLPWYQRPGAEAGNIALQRLALRMRACNAPVGAVYNGGADLVVVERDFNHDLLRLRQLASSRTTRRSAAAMADCVERDLTLDLRLDIWSHSFTHRDAKSAHVGEAQAENPVGCVAAIALYALDQVKRRPKALDDAKYNEAIRQFLVKNGVCPSQTLAKEGAKTAETAHESLQETTASDSSKASMLASLTSFTCLLQNVTSTRVQCKGTSTSEDSDAEPEHPADQDWLIATGSVNCSLGGARPYLLVSLGTSPRVGRFATVHSSSLYVVTEASKTATATRAIASALRIDTDRPGDAASAEKEADLSLRADRLYRTDALTAQRTIKALRTVCGAKDYACESVIVKVPTLVGRSWLSFNAESASFQGNAAAHDELLCKCPRGLCDAVCSGCTGSDHEYEITAAQRHIKSLILAFKVEHAALSSLAGAYEQSQADPDGGGRRPCFARLIALQPAFNTSKSAVAKFCPLLEPLLDRTWPVYLDAGEPLKTVMEYADVCKTSHATPDKFPWADTDDDLWMSRELFSFFTLCPVRVDVAMAEARQQLQILNLRKLAPRYLDTDNVFVKFAGQEDLDLFGTAAARSGSGTEFGAFCTLMELSDCQFWGDCADLDAAEEEVVQPGSRPRGLPDRVAGFMPLEQSEGATVFRYMADEDLGSRWGNFEDAWFYDHWMDDPLGQIGGSAAPLDVSSEDELAMLVPTVEKDWD